MAFYLKRTNGTVFYADRGDQATTSDGTVFYYINASTSKTSNTIQWIQGGTGTNTYLKTTINDKSYYLNIHATSYKAILWPINSDDSKISVDFSDTATGPNIKHTAKEIYLGILNSSYLNWNASATALWTTDPVDENTPSQTYGCEIYYQDGPNNILKYEQKIWTSTSNTFPYKLIFPEDLSTNDKKYEFRGWTWNGQNNPTTQMTTVEITGSPHKELQSDGTYLYGAAFYINAAWYYKFAGNARFYNNFPDNDEGKYQISEIQYTTQHTTTSGTGSTTVNSPSAPTAPTNYRFKEWNTKSSGLGEISYQENVPVPVSTNYAWTARTDYYAIWEKTTTINCIAEIEYYYSKDDNEYYQKTEWPAQKKNPDDAPFYINVTLQAGNRLYYNLDNWVDWDHPDVTYKAGDKYPVKFSVFNVDDDNNFSNTTVTVKVYGDWTAHKWEAKIYYDKNISNLTPSNMPSNNSWTYTYGSNNSSNWSFSNGVATYTGTIPSTPTLDAYIFKQWNTKSLGDGNSITDNKFSISVAHNPNTNGVSTTTLTLYAIWIQGGVVYIFVDNQWKKAMPFIYAPNSNTDTKPWKVAIPYIYDNGKWKQTTV